MTQITLAKALKLKNRAAERLNKLRADITCYNSVQKGQVVSVDANQTLKYQATLAEMLTQLKVSISAANVELQKLIFQNGELKAEISWLSGIPTLHGTTRSSYSDAGIEHVAQLQKTEIDARIRSLEAQLDTNNDILDQFNATRKIEVSEVLFEFTR